MKINNNIPAYRFQGYTDAWELRKLGEVAKYRNGKAHEQSIVAEGDYVVINSKFVSTGGVVEKFSSRQLEPLYKNEIAFVLSDIPNGKALSKTFLVDVDQKYTLNQRIAAITPKESASFLNELLNRNSYFLKFDNGVGQTNLAKDQVLEFNAFFPSLPEQETIGTFFSTLDQHITLHQRKLDTLKEQKKTYLKLLFPAKGQTKPALRFKGFEDDWEEVKLGEVCTIQGGNAWKSDSYSLTGEYLVVTIANVTGEYFIADKKGNRIDINPNEMQYVLKKGDILISLTGNVGRVSKMTESKGVLNQRVGKLTTTANFEFIFSILRTEKFENEMRLASQGAAQANISNKDVLQYMILLPSLPEQEAIGTFFQTLDQEIAQVEDKLASLKEMKKTLLHRIFV
ncbi:restriction endonuclease subunit S [Streptococcus suis]|uniref:restriction endonuclease subunit S n=1 Tax=Streptococcus suis TaxID=1307 RepID=UPI00041A0176|nr:restriction endonuclease subunit S [Streptococcus suis]MBS8071087.1 restriction endonuclease subunit S [Streptococcus suis]MBS8094802.1 restriction endonuclease subunit S [Streptococcus suis]MBS8103644.1 restriction endonuclease subunit S [Streptococcus suis]TQE84664.1 restriction endonuclease subunit S [Streptococcus suis]HEM4248628.1 restriction endonuclease subunit S [Streptococcus suis]